jgi:hypothetical protein
LIPFKHTVLNQNTWGFFEAHGIEAIYENLEKSQENNPQNPRRQKLLQTTVPLVSKSLYSVLIAQLEKYGITPTLLAQFLENPRQCLNALFKNKEFWLLTKIACAGLSHLIRILSTPQKIKKLPLNTTRKVADR